jgi:hypothetical protein
MAGHQEVRVSADSPSCEVMKYRLIFLDKEFIEWKELTKKMGPQSSMKDLREMSSLLRRIQGMTGIASEDDVEVSVQWTLPLGAPLDQKDLVVGVQTPRHNWLSPWEQRLPEFNLNIEGQIVSLKIKLSSLEYCLGNPHLVVQLGKGFEPPFEEMSTEYEYLDTDLTKYQTQAFMFHSED